jgi:hypothetical protein
MRGFSFCLARRVSRLPRGIYFFCERARGVGDTEKFSAFRFAFVVGIL